MSRGAGGMNPDVEDRLRAAYADHLIVDFDPKSDFEKRITSDARVVVGGGDGTIEFVVRKLAESTHPLGILPLGSFNNLAKALNLPSDLDHAIDVTRNGTARPITLGRVNDHIFVEACAIGLFGDAIVLGDSAKDREFGTMVEKLREVAEAKPFHYELTGDLHGEGDAMSLVFSNTSSMGSLLPVSDASPIDSYLEFSADAGQSHVDIVGRVVASALLQIHREEDARHLYRFSRLQVTTRPRVRIYADNRSAGHTPATVTAQVSALKVMLP
jgi:diacylglycerol kinase family enzyme